MTRSEPTTVRELLESLERLVDEHGMHVMDLPVKMTDNQRLRRYEARVMYGGTLYGNRVVIR